MSEPRVIRADYANWRPVAGRKVLQLVFEVPIEQTSAVMTMLGVPMPGESKWCAIALLDNGPVAELVDAEGLKPSDESRVGSNPTGAHHKDRRPFNTLPLSQQAAIRSQDEDFGKFIFDGYWLQEEAPTTDEISSVVRKICGVDSRSKIVLDTPAGDKWGQLEIDYQAWRTTRQYGAARHG